MSSSPLTDAELGALCLDHLESVVRVDSQSDEASTTIPTTEGQRRMGDQLERFYAALGARVERDASANVLAWFPGRGAGASRPPVALMVHMDTARGTAAVPHLHVQRAWSGDRIPFPNNPGIRVDIATYPSLEMFRGHDVVHGEGDSPFGLDDKLGLSHCMGLATLLARDPTLPHPPLVLVGRPDEEVGRHEAVVELAATLQRAGVKFGYTIDGITPFEINVENFWAAAVQLAFGGGAARPFMGAAFVAHIGGVNTHGATARAEGHRAAPRLVAEWAGGLDQAQLRFDSLLSDERRDCDAVVRVTVAPGAEGAAREALAAVMAPHLDRGASWTFERDPAPPTSDAAATEAVIAFLRVFYASRPGFTLACEESDGRDGYTHPYRVRRDGETLRLDLRIRDFESQDLDRRVAHVLALAAASEARPAATRIDQYVNMGPRLARYPELVTYAQAAAAAVGIAPLVQPIRGGTGVDPFLERDIPVANLGTGYFAPESEKELTSLQLMVGHVRWLVALMGVLAEG